MRILVGVAAVSIILVAHALACTGSEPTNGSDGASSGAAASGGVTGSDASSGGTSGTSDGSASAPEGGAADPVELATNTMKFEGRDRTYVVAKPKTYDARKAYPLVMAFHGNPSSAANMIARQPFAAAGSDAIVVYPQAASPSDTNPGFFDWDIYTVTKDNADMSWIVALVDEIKKTLNVDKSRVFAFGYSGGGFFVAHFACRFAGYFRAISSHAGGGPDEEAMGFQKRPSGCFVCPGGPTATLVTHGKLDDQVEPGSGEFTASCFAETNGCSGSRAPTQPAPCEQYDGCPGGKPVKICMLPQQDHEIWPNAAGESWAFFRTFL